MNQISVDTFLTIAPLFLFCRASLRPTMSMYHLNGVPFCANAESAYFWIIVETLQHFKLGKLKGHNLYVHFSCIFI